MKKIIIVLLITLTIFVGVFSWSAQAEACPWNVHATVVHGNKSYTYNLQNYLDVCDKKVAFLGQKSRWQLYQYLQTLPLTEKEIYNYILPNFDDVLQFFADVCHQKRDATVHFDKNGFTYLAGADGVSINQKQVFESMLLCHNGESIVLPLVVHKATTVTELKHSTQLRATFTTQFPNSNTERVHNITLATNAINGTIVDVGQTFSFNQVVGKRTEQNGYKTAKVIVDGTYVDGVGGGVCQVSTTLYNALLLADILPSACQHSLISNYVLAGFDAMVSDLGADLTFVNNTASPIYIQGVVKGKSVTFSIFGLPNNWQIERESVAEVEPFDTVEVVDTQKYPHLVYTDQTQVVRGGSNGVKTQSYLKYYQNGKLVATKLIRKNSYKKVDKIVARGHLERPTDCTLPNELQMGSCFYKIAPNSVF